MSTEQNKALARRLYDEAWNKGNLDIVDQLVSAGYVSHEAADNPLLPEEGAGPEGIKQSLVTYRTAFPDVRFTIEDQIAEGDKVVTRYVASATQTGPLGRIPPTGKRASIGGIWIDRFADGKIVESWSNFDALGLLMQLGVLPVPQR